MPEGAASDATSDHPSPLPANTQTESKEHDDAKAAIVDGLDATTGRGQGDNSFEGTRRQGPQVLLANDPDNEYAIQHLKNIFSR